MVAAGGASADEVDEDEQDDDAEGAEGCDVLPTTVRSGSSGRSSEAAVGEETRATAVTAVTSSAIPHHKRGVWLPAILLVALGGIAAYLIMGGDERSADSEVGASTSSAASADGLPATTAAAAGATATASAVAAAATSVSATATATATASAPPARPPTTLTFPKTTAPASPQTQSSAQPPSARRNCDPPFTMGSDNVKRYKPWCLK